MSQQTVGTVSAAGYTTTIVEENSGRHLTLNNLVSHLNGKKVRVTIEELPE